MSLSYQEHERIGKTKGVKPNNDFCSYCSEGGPLICCEKCPAAYHYHCCEPPLDPNNLPSEEWLCNSCTPPQLITVVEMSADKQDLVSEWTDLVNDIQSKVEWSCEKELTVIKMLDELIEKSDDLVEQLMSTKDDFKVRVSDILNALL